MKVEVNAWVRTGTHGARATALIGVALVLVALGAAGCASGGMTATQRDAADWLVTAISKKSMVRATNVQVGVRDDWTVYRDGLVNSNQKSGRPVVYADAPNEPPNMDPTRDPKNGPFYFTANVEGSATRAAFVVWRDSASAPWQYVSGPGGP